MAFLFLHPCKKYIRVGFKLFVRFTSCSGVVGLDGRDSHVCMRVRVLKTLRGFRFALNSQHCREAASPFFSAKLLLPSYSIKNELSEESLTD